MSLYTELKIVYEDDDDVDSIAEYTFVMMSI